MSYVLRRITEEDKEFFINNGVKSPFGGRPSFGRFLVENLDEDVKMILLGGQGIMKEDGTEWSETASYCAILWRGKKYTVEFYSVKKWFEQEENKSVFESVYKIKSVNTYNTSEERKDIFEGIIKKCIETYDFNRYESSICKNVTFCDIEVRWG